MGPKIAILTGYSTKDNNIGAIAYNKETKEYTSYLTKKVNAIYHGTGDIFSSSFVGSYLNGSNLYESLRKLLYLLLKVLKTL